MPRLSTGLMLVPSLQLRTKVSAVPAGPSPPLEASRVPGKSRIKNLCHFQSNNLLTAPPSDMETSVATVVSNKELTNIPMLLLWRLKLTTLTLLKMEPAVIKLARVLSNPLDTQWLPLITSPI